MCAIAEELVAEIAINGGLATDIFACNSRSTNKGNNHSN